MSRPATILAFHHVSGAPAPYAPLVRDVTRPGGTPTFLSQGPRGRAGGVEGRAYYASEELAQLAAAAIEAAQGSEVVLQDTRLAREWQGVVLTVTTEIRQCHVSSSDAALNGLEWQVKAAMEFERTVQQAEVA